MLWCLPNNSGARSLKTPHGHSGKLSTYPTLLVLVSAKQSFGTLRNGHGCDAGKVESASSLPAIADQNMMLIRAFLRGPHATSPYQIPGHLVQSFLLQ